MIIMKLLHRQPITYHLLSLIVCYQLIATTTVVLGLSLPLSLSQRHVLEPSDEDVLEQIAFGPRLMTDQADDQGLYNIVPPQPQLQSQPKLYYDVSNSEPIEQNKQNNANEIYILEDKDYPKSLYEHYPGVGQVSGIATLPSGDVAIFHRSDREWNETTFNEITNRVVDNAQDNLIKNDTIMIIDRENGNSVTTFGSNLFYMPHSIASDNEGNLWVTDVARHQVMRLPTSMMQLYHINAVDGRPIKRWLPGNLSRIWPDIILGEAFVSGQDEAHFCKPSEVAVSANGQLVYVADGYCNKRVMVFTGLGKFVTSFGQDQQFNIVHSLTLFEDRNLICVADRENGRIFCYKAGLDGDPNTIGELVLSIDYPLGRVFAIETISPSHMLVSSNQRGTSRYDLAALNPFSSELKQIWTSSDLSVPHSLAATKDGQYVYAADMSKEAYKKVFKFNIIQRMN